MALAALGGWPRRALAVMCLLAAVVAGLSRPAGTGAASAPPGIPVLVAARDLAAGVALTAADVRIAAIPAGLVPAGAIGSMAAITGRVAAGPVRRGEPLTDARLLGRGLATGLSPPESVAVPVRLADAETAALVRPGDRIDLLATPVDTALGAPPGESAAVESTPGGPGPPSGSAAAASAPDGAARPADGSDSAGPAGPAGRPPDAIVLATAVRVLAVLADPQANTTDGVLMVVATSDRVARQLTAAAAQQRLSVTLRPP
jgi:hypothetical protein